MHGLFGQQALRIAQQAGAVGGARGVLDFFKQRAELGRVVAPVIVGLGKVAQVKGLDVGDQGEVVVLVAIGAAEPLGPFHILDLGHDADLGQLRRNHLAPLAGIGRRGQRERERERGLDARFGQQFFGLVDIERVDARGVHIPESARHIVAANGHAKAVTRAFDDGLAVDGGGNGTAHAHVVQGLAVVVDGQDGLGARAAHHHLKARVGLELGHAAWRDAGKRVHITGQQRRHLRGRVGDEAERGPAHLDAGGRAKARPGVQRDGRTLVPCAQHVGAGAHGPRGIGGGTFGLDDDGRGLAQHKQEIRVDVLVDQHHGVVIHHLGGEAGKGALVLVGALVAARAVEREFDRIGREGHAVAELHPPAQAQGVGLEVGRHLPALGQQRRHTAVGIDLGERLEDVVVNDLGNGRGGTGGRVQPRWFQRHGQHHVVLAGFGQGAPGRGKGHRGDGASGKD